MTQDIRVGLLFRRVLSRWAWIVALAILGGLLGLAVTWLRPPEYEAVASLDIGIDYGRSQPLSDEATREAFLRVQDLLLADDTLRAAAASLPPDMTGTVTPDNLRSDIRLERFDPKWDMQAFSTSPDQAAAIANAWAESALSALQVAQTHAWRAADLQGKLYRASCTLEAEVGAAEPKWVCHSGEPDFSPDQAVGQLMHEAELSQGILPNLSFSLQHRAKPPQQVAVYGRGTVVLAGFFLGWLVGIGLVLGVGTFAGSVGRKQDGPLDDAG